MADHIPVELLTRESLNACVQAYTSRTKSLVTDPAGSVLYDFCQDHGIRKLVTEEHCFLRDKITPCVTYWIVKDAYQSFNRFCYIWRGMRSFTDNKYLVDTTQAFVTDWLEDPEVAKMPPDVGHDSQQYPVDYVIRQCRLMLEVIYPIHTPSDAARRLCLYEDSMVKQLRRHRLLYSLKDYL